MSEVKNDKYLIVCDRHRNMYGDMFVLWWGCDEKQSGYTSDFRHAHLYDYEDIKSHLNSCEDPAIKLSDLDYTEEQFKALPKDENLRILIEKATLNDLLGFKFEEW